MAGDEDNEIGLVDIFAVLLRYRKMIALGTIAVALAAALFFAVAPKLSPASAEPEALYDVSYAVSVSDIPLDIKSYIVGFLGTGSADLRAYFNICFDDLSVLIPIYKKYNLWPARTEPKTDSELATFVAELRNEGLRNEGLQRARAQKSEAQIGSGNPVYALNAGTLYFYLFPNELSTAISLLKLPQAACLPNGTGEGAAPLALQFARDVVSEANRRAEEAILPLIEAIAAVPLAAPAIASSAERFVKGYGGFFELYEVPVMAPSAGSSFAPGRRPAAYIAIAALLGLFAFVFLAFLRNALARVRQDERSMRLLEDAWQGGKKGL